ncbi:hypothetical protein ACIOC2_06725 [Streptomyces sp. NPDC088337]|uniref:hypothetical protein n=1 Tax=unclassified Streptomyces TaxID=2593676 RepID=UPI000CAA8054|nr:MULTISPECIES: hypothetical protein [unclassified Streptomyces]PJM97187.1 hypothetical protein CG719_03970 [Streptomyces sp. CB01373]WSB26520.1 hypothetical protein OIE49_11760 [Streptomyces sp. NBC_01788]
MSDASTTQPSAADVEESAAHGKHRGPVSVGDGEAAPSGRHRRPAEQNESAA